MSGLSIVLVPGLGLGPDAWRGVIAELRDSDVAKRVSVVPLPGFGRQADRHTDLRPESLGSQLLDTSRAEAASDMVLLGHSASCQVVAHAATQDPDHVRGVVLSGPTTDPRAASWRALVRRWLGTARNEPPWQVPSLVRQYRRTGITGIFRAMDAARRDDMTEVVQRLRCPVLLVRGKDDRIAPQDWVDHLAAKAGTIGPGSGAAESAVTTVTLPVGAHMLPVTEPRLLSTAIIRFVQALGSGQPDSTQQATGDAP